MRPLSLTPRLLAIAQRIPKDAKVADIGTDHARLPVYLCEQNITHSVIATDIRDGPLERARRTLERHRLVDIVELRKCDGLQGIHPDEADIIVISGMGGDSIAEILLSSYFLYGKQYILQPMTHPEKVIHALNMRELVVAEHIQVCEANRVYTLIFAGGMENDNSI